MTATAKPSGPELSSQTFQTSLRWTDVKRGMLESPEAGMLAVATPKVFGGSGNDWSPETLFLGAVESCTMLTFFAYAERRGLRILTYSSRTTGVLGRDDSGKMRFLSVTVRPVVEVATPAEITSVLEAFARIEGKCFIGSSLKEDPKVEPNVVAQSPEGQHP